MGPELNETGRTQARHAAIQFEEHLARIDLIVVSPMIRAQETAQIVNETLKVSIHTLENLREWKLGQWCRQSFENVKTQFLGNGEPLGGEPRKNFQLRIEKAFQEALSLSKNPLIVAHGGVWLAAQKIYGFPVERLQNGVPLRAWTEDSKQWKLERLDYV